MYFGEEWVLGGERERNLPLRKALALLDFKPLSLLQRPYLQYSHTGG